MDVLPYIDELVVPVMLEQAVKNGPTPDACSMRGDQFSFSSSTEPDVLLHYVGDVIREFQFYRSGVTYRPRVLFTCRGL